MLALGTTWQEVYANALLTCCTVRTRTVCRDGEVTKLHSVDLASGGWLNELHKDRNWLTYQHGKEHS